MSQATAQLVPLPTPPPRSSAGVSTRRYAGKHLWWHDAIIDAMLARPGDTKTDIARSLNCTPQIIYMISGSDLFKARFEQRRQEFNRIHDQAVVVGLNRVAESTLDLIGQVLAKKGDSVPLPQLVDLADKTLNRLGYGVKPAAQAAPVQVNVGGTTVAVSADAILEARSALRRSEQAKLVEGPAAEGCPRPEVSDVRIPFYEPTASTAASMGRLLEGEVERQAPSTALFLGDCGADESDL